ncbi:MAG: GntR family transcriptional regulator [Oscillospiraceae bacterium]|nr:GntR family transcriptional regulator [Oscillospiraceae bacterium]
MDTIYNCNEIFRILESEILSLSIAPGQVLSEHQLCERFSVSRTPIRSVLQRLQEKELVNIVPYKGTVVTLLDFDIVNQMIYQRVAVETMVLRDFIRNSSPLDVELARHALSNLTDAYAPKDNGALNPDYFFKVDLQMHELWFKSTRKPYLWENIRRQQSSYTRFCVLDMLETRNYEHVIKEHTEMLRLIETKETSSIEDLLTQHLYGGVRRLGSMVFNEFKDYFIPPESTL